MPLPMLDVPIIAASLDPNTRREWDPVPKKQILSNYTHRAMEDRISQRTWYNNVTYPDEIRKSLVCARNVAARRTKANPISSSDPKMK